MADEPFSSGTKGFKWTKRMIVMLISLIKENFERLENGVKKTAYQEIANTINNVFDITLSYEQVDSKWKGLKKTYNKIKEDNKTTAQSRKSWEYYDLIDEILFRAPESNPPAVLSSEDIVVVQCDPAFASTESEYEVDDQQPTFPTNFRKRRRISREDPAERRHRERMDASNRFLDLFQKMVDKV